MSFAGVLESALYRQSVGMVARVMDCVGRHPLADTAQNRRKVDEVRAELMAMRQSIHTVPGNELVRRIDAALSRAELSS
jgi:hypothetical protein